MIRWTGYSQTVTTNYVIEEQVAAAPVKLIERECVRDPELVGSPVGKAHVRTRLRAFRKTGDPDGIRIDQYGSGRRSSVRPANTDVGFGHIRFRHRIYKAASEVELGRKGPLHKEVEIIRRAS